MNQRWRRCSYGPLVVTIPELINGIFGLFMNGKVDQRIFQFREEGDFVATYEVNKIW